MILGLLQTSYVTAFGINLFLGGGRLEEENSDTPLGFTPWAAPLVQSILLTVRLVILQPKQTQAVMLSLLLI